jgi:hypothetical protein
MSAKRDSIREEWREGELVLLDLPFAGFEMGRPNQIDCIRAGGKEKNG